MTKNLLTQLIKTFFTTFFSLGLLTHCSYRSYGRKAFESKSQTQLVNIQGNATLLGCETSKRTPSEQPLTPPSNESELISAKENEEIWSEKKNEQELRWITVTYTHDEINRCYYLEKQTID